MKGDFVPDTDHVSRYCSRSRLTEEGKVTAAAFQLKEHEQSISVNWLEFLSQPNRQAEIAEVRKVLTSNRITLRRTGRIAVLNVGETRNHVYSATHPDSKDLHILHDPLPNDSSHSGIFGVMMDDQLIPELIVQTVKEIHPALD
ncbi:hypothetical protein MYX78_08070 [Acidobacteria bacterium AH-259-G07]|nr:hypothetical protein [Acidobacteria bacterium AH-259-G07]